MGNDRPLLNPSHQFTMPNGIRWTCNYLQETVQDVDENGWESERIMCRHAQLQAEGNGCQCGGAPLPPLSTQYSDIHPACDMCATVSGSPAVPMSNWDKLISTGVIGTHNCKGLFEAMADGIIGSNLCPTVQQVAGPECCLESPSYTQSQYIANNDYTISYNSGGSNPVPPAPVPAPSPSPTPAPTPAPVPQPQYTTSTSTSTSSIMSSWSRTGRSSINDQRNRNRVGNMRGDYAAV